MDDVDLFKGHRYSPEIIDEAVWLRFRFNISFRDTQDLLFRSGIVVSHEAIRQWAHKFGDGYARKLKRRRPQPGDKWMLDEMFVRIDGVQHYMWRAVDPDGVVLGVLVTKHRDSRSARKFLRKIVKSEACVPRVIVTDKLASYGAAMNQNTLGGVEHRQSKYLNNRVENSHQPLRHREYQMCRFKSVGQAQRFASAHGSIYQHFKPKRHQMTASQYRIALTEQQKVWHEITTELAA